MNVFNWRADGLDLKVDMSYEDHVGPVALVGSILGALLLSCSPLLRHDSFS